MNKDRAHLLDQLQQGLITAFGALVAVVGVAILALLAAHILGII